MSPFKRDAIVGPRVPRRRHDREVTTRLKCGLIMANLLKHPLKHALLKNGDCEEDVTSHTIWLSSPSLDFNVIFFWSKERDSATCWLVE